MSDLKHAVDIWSRECLYQKESYYTTVNVLLHCQKLVTVISLFDLHVQLLCI